MNSPLRGWETPGGQVEEGESLLQALKREIWEESGVSAAAGVLTGVYSNIQAPPKLIVSFLAAYESGQTRPSPESSEVRWVRRDEALRMVIHPAIRQRVADLLAFDGRVVYRVYRTNPYELLETQDLSPASWWELDDLSKP